ncbi:antitoxin [Mycolicibacterium murale]|jgi:hypothetical protein|uniref:Antitoxin n=1 Tax=Mycolicibacterium murale TaxID=182220 RepID=A0A7I9WLL4_9MYCO|nr:antitoxin [Mycolicibacterium murale]MCV7185267.1 antitoxin [Mycolicibacterium murale]GFG58489.1 antitoxin [Mycolicibacterium murale]
MRTTVTLDEDTLAVVRRRMRERGVSFKTALNDAIRAGALVEPQPGVFATTTADLGVPTVSLDRALEIAADLEDEELMRRP